ncbi:MAG: penicillin acylase family protein [Candidatus Marinimicrobia bacterium]|nr:penicillin acylase family protein [Candidatus Neomarinimicrobiota bacterium]
MRTYLLFISIFLIISSCGKPPREVEILWDEYGIPHIYAQNTNDLFYAYGWAQTHAHGDLLLRLYGQARGRAAEYWGEKFLKSDKWMWINGVPERSERWSKEQVEPYKSMLESYVAGINDYVKQNPKNIDENFQVVVPITLQDVMAHVQRVLHFTFVFSQDDLENSTEDWNEQRGSNAWAIGPNRSASGNTMLLANPHLYWGDLFTWFEVHLNLPDKNIYGASLVGTPALGILFNEHLGFSHTVNTHDGADLYELTLVNGGYEFDQEIKTFEIDSIELKIKSGDSFQTELFVVKSSIHGPVVIEENGKALALKVVALDASQIFKERWEMATSTNLNEFEASLKSLQTPLFTVMYADNKGNILHLFGGQTPKRPPGDYDWAGVVPGNTSETLWSEVHTYEELPRILNPESGWLQNANDPPWTTTFPEEIDPNDYPDYMSPRKMGFRAQRSARMLNDDDSITYDELVAYKFSTRMELADRLLDDLLDAASTANDDEIKDAVRVLKRWDRTADNSSRGSVLFKHWVDDMNFPDDFALQWNERSPTQLPDGLKDRTMAVHRLYGAAKEVKEKYGRLDVFWGEVFRLQRDSLDLPANGAPGDPYGVFRTSYFRPIDDYKQTLIAGDTYVAVIEFGDSIRANGVIGYGNFSQAGSSHRTDQLKLYSDKKLRPILFYRKDVEANVVERTTF